MTFLQGSPLGTSGNCKSKVKPPDAISHEQRDHMDILTKKTLSLVVTWLQREQDI